MKAFLNFKITLRYLATGQSMTSLHYEWNISLVSISQIIIDVCEAINTNLMAVWLEAPSSPQQWLQVAEGFEKWNYPNCIGM